MKKNNTILIVEDHEVERIVLEKRLEKNGFRCLTAEDGSKALGTLKREAVDLVISDQIMPGMDGMALLMEVRQKYEGLPFIMVTGQGNVADAVNCIKFGAVDYRAYA